MTPWHLTRGSVGESKLSWRPLPCHGTFGQCRTQLGSGGNGREAQQHSGGVVHLVGTPYSSSAREIVTVRFPQQSPRRAAVEIMADEVFCWLGRIAASRHPAATSIVRLSPALDLERGAPATRTTCHFPRGPRSDPRHVSQVKAPPGE